MKKLTKQVKDKKYILLLEDCIKELFRIKNPSINITEDILIEINKTISDNVTHLTGNVYKDLNTLFQNSSFDLSTSRNRNLIQYQQQTLLKSKVVGFFGMSVGSHAALTWMMESRADVIKIIDPDIIMPTNLNRLRFGWNTIGKFKVDIVRQELKKINPKVRTMISKKTDTRSVEKIFNDEKKLDLVVDEIDNISDKLLLRKLAEKYRIPLISATDVGENVLLDVEDYSSFPQPDYFLGRIPNIHRLELNKITALEKRKLAISYVGLEHNSEAMLASLTQIGKTIVTWPQLGATATISGGVITTLIKKILLGEGIKSGRYIIDLDQIFQPDYNSEDKVNKRLKIIEELKKV